MSDTADEADAPIENELEVAPLPDPVPPLAAAPNVKDEVEAIPDPKLLALLADAAGALVAVIVDGKVDEKVPVLVGAGAAALIALVLVSDLSAGADDPKALAPPNEKDVAEFFSADLLAEPPVVLPNVKPPAPVPAPIVVLELDAVELKLPKLEDVPPNEKPEPARADKEKSE